MSRLIRDGTDEPVSRCQILRRELAQGNTNFPCSAGHKKDWQPYPVDPYSLNASRPSEESTQTGEKMSKRLGGIIGCKDKTSSWCLNGFPDRSNIGSTV